MTQRAEGDTTRGTILFAEDADARLEIAWLDGVRARRPAVIRRMAGSGRWHTSSGIALGTDLRTVERLNGRPFRLAGMAFDAQGTVVSWEGGRLEEKASADSHVHVALRVESYNGPAAQALERQVSGDRVFFSSHPAMQALNPTVYSLALGCGRRMATWDRTDPARLVPVMVLGSHDAIEATEDGRENDRMAAARE